MPLPDTVRATVDPSIISRVGRLFNGSIGDVLAELLQNARRAGARRVGASALDLDGRRVLAVVDDGRGIDDPAALLSLGHSGWDGGTALREDPAGMGFFSLAGRRVEVRSRSRALDAGWRMVIEPPSWQSGDPIAVAPFALAGGTEILVELPAEWERDLERAVRAAARHLPLSVLFQGVECERADWLADAVLVEEWRGSRIGVLPGGARPAYEPTVNFHGVTVPLQLPAVAEVGRGRAWHVRIDIGDTPELQLVLPARKEVVQTPFLDALRTACEGILFRAVAAGGPHRLGFADYRRALELGVPLDEAAPALHGWRPATADGVDKRGALIDRPAFRVGGFESLLAHTAARAIALAGAIGQTLAAKEPAFAGYAWYDALDEVRDLRVRISQNGVERVMDQHHGLEVATGRVDRITVELVIAAADGAERVLRYPSDVALAAVEGYASDLDEVAVLVAPGPTIDVAGIVDLLAGAVFAPGDDRDSDSYDTQRDAFERDALQLARTVLIGADAAITGRARDRVRDHICWLVPDGRTLLIAATRDDADALFRDDTPAGVDELAFIDEIERLSRSGEAAPPAIRHACAERRRALLARAAASTPEPIG